MSKLRFTLVHVILAGNLFLAAECAYAQTADAELRSVRQLTFGSTSFLNTSEPSFYAGFLYQISINKTRITTNDLGDSLIIPPKWYAHSQIMAGYAFDSDKKGSGGFAGGAQLGFMYRLDGPFKLNSLGLVGQANWGPEGYGPAQRFEFFGGNAALSIGRMHFEDKRVRPHSVFVSID